MASTGMVLTARSFAEIEAILTGLGDPAPGRRRVYRGQDRFYTRTGTSDHTITPALARRSTPFYDPGWLVRLTHFLALADNSTGRGLPVEFPLVWAPALIQHYGPGSHFVDVTFDVTVALWFSCHLRHEQWMSVYLGNADGVYLQRVRTAWYTTPAEDDAAATRRVLYVFDLPVWDGSVMPGEPGMIVDLLGSSVGAWLRDHAPRLAAQHAALLHARWEPDVWPEARATIELAPELDRRSVPGVDRPTREIFPLPGDDLFYQLLLTLPSRLRFEPSRFEHALDLPCYLSATPNVWEAAEVTRGAGTGGEDSPVVLSWDEAGSGLGSSWLAEINAYIKKFTHAAPALLHADIARRYRDSENTRAVAVVNGRAHAFSDATRILLESVLYVSTPPVEDGDACPWIESALSLGIADEIDGHGTANVYVEFAPADFADPLQGGFNVSPRGLWLVRDRSWSWFRIFRQDRQGLREEDVVLEYDDARGVFAPAGVATTKARPVGAGVDRHAIRKALFVTLALLRDASPGYKPPPLHQSTSRSEDGIEHAPPGVLAPQRARLVPIARNRYLSPRDAETGAVYTLGVRQVDYPTPDDTSEARRVLERCLPHIRDRSYVVAAALVLARLQGDAKAWPDVIATTDRALKLLEGTSVFGPQKAQLLLMSATAKYLAEATRQ